MCLDFNDMIPERLLPRSIEIGNPIPAEGVLLKEFEVYDDGYVPALLPKTTETYDMYEHVAISAIESTRATFRAYNSPSALTPGVQRYNYEIRTNNAPFSNEDVFDGYVASGNIDAFDGLGNPNIVTTTLASLVPDTFLYVNFRLNSIASPGVDVSPVATTTFTTGHILTPLAVEPPSKTLDSFTAKWNPSLGASSYRVDVSEDPLFGSFLPGYNDATTSFAFMNITGLNPMSNYYYRVRAVGTESTGTVTTGNSNVITVRTKAF